MLWFSNDVINTDMMFSNYLTQLRHMPLDEADEEVAAAGSMFQAPGKAAGKLDDFKLLLQWDLLYFSSIQFAKHRFKVNTLEQSSSNRGSAESYCFAKYYQGFLEVLYKYVDKKIFSTN